MLQQKTPNSRVTADQTIMQSDWQTVSPEHAY